MLERYDWESLQTSGAALNEARHSTIDEIARAIDVPASYLEQVMLGDEPVGGVLLAKFCRDQGLSPLRFV